MGRRVTVDTLNCRRITLILEEFVCSTGYMRTFFQASIDDISQAMLEVYSNFNHSTVSCISSATGTTINTPNSTFSTEFDLQICCIQHQCLVWRQIVTSFSTFVAIDS